MEAGGMRGGRPASLDGSLLARKGGAAPAIPDESPLVLNLDEHRSAPVDTAPAPAPAPVDADNADGVGSRGEINGILRQVLGGIKRIPVRIRWSAIAAVAVLVVAVLWLSNNSDDAVPVQADSTPNTVPLVVADNPGLQLNLTPTPEKPEPAPGSVVEPESAETAVPLPASAALAVTSAPNEASAAVAPTVDAVETEPAGGTLIPVNVPPNETQAPLGDVDSASGITAALPKTVSPVPVPKAKPVLVGIPGGRYAVQLASIGREKRATEEAFRLQKQLGDVLGGREIQVESAVVKGKGTMYRLRASGFETYAEARAACAQVKQLKGSCLALRR